MAFEMQVNLLCAFIIAVTINFPSSSFCHVMNGDHEFSYTSHGSYSRIETDGRRHVIDHSANPMSEFDRMERGRDMVMDPEESTWISGEDQNSDSLPRHDQILLMATPWTHDIPVVHGIMSSGPQTGQNMGQYDSNSDSNNHALHSSMHDNLQANVHDALKIPEPQSMEKLPFGYVSPVAKIPVPAGYKIHYDN